MSGASRKIKRAKKKKAQKEMQEKIFMFDKLGNECLACKEPFDKRSREQVQSWNVVVRKKEEKVNLYCPECWGKARNAIEQVMRKKNDN